MSSTCLCPGRGAATRCSAGNLASSRVAGSKIRSAWRSGASGGVGVGRAGAARSEVGESSLASNRSGVPGRVGVGRAGCSSTLGYYSSGMIDEWSPPDEYDQVEVASLVPDHPMSGLVVAWFFIMSLVFLLLERFFFFAHQSDDCWSGRWWGHVDHVRSDDGFPSCLFKELSCKGVILALQSSGAVHLGVDNLGVVRHVGRLLDGCHGTVPYELVKDGDHSFSCSADASS